MNPSATADSGGTTPDQLAVLIARLSALESDVKTYKAAAGQAEAREAKLQSQISSLTSALNGDKEAGWLYRCARCCLFATCADDGYF